jgi:hypothetical protein
MSGAAGSGGSVLGVAGAATATVTANSAWASQFIPNSNSVTSVTAGVDLFGSVSTGYTLDSVNNNTPTGTLTVNGSLSSNVVLGAGGTIVIGNGGATVLTVTQGSNVAAQLVINNLAEIKLAPNIHTVTLSSLKINNGGLLDITNNTLRIPFGSPASDPVATIQQYLSNGYNGGTWTGTSGIVSSTAAGNPSLLSVGYADGNTDSGTAAAPNQLVIKYTLAGDANLAGTVNFNDLVAVVQNFNKSGTDWAHGNFSYGASTNFGDLVAVVQNFNKTLNSAGSSGDQLGGSTAPLDENQSIQSTDVQLPEPTHSALALASVAVFLSTRRRRHKAHMT